jgi:glycosyltransferase involved in cell wall biosynthesis
MERATTSPDPVLDDAGLERSEPQRIAELERQVALWRLRAESAEAAISVWRETQGRSLWRFLVAVDRLRARVAPPRTRRDRIARAAAYRLSNALLRVGRDVPQRTERVVPTGHKAVLFVFDDLGGICTRYRCDHQAEQMRFLGTSHDIAHSAEIDLAAAVDHYEVFLLSRVAWSDEVAAFFEQARARNKLVIFDTDDLIFEPELDRHFAFLDNATENERASWIEKLGAYRKTLEACDGVIVTTETLRRLAQPRNERVQVVFNAESEELLRLADDAMKAHAGGYDRYDRSDVTIAYLSGTPTHNRDFLEAADAVLWALDNYPNARLLIVGKLDLDSRFDRFTSRITRIRKQPWQAVPGILDQVDINLAPLERDNLFTESKSCLKYLEAALLGVPTVASPRDDFARAIDHGRNGLLADNRHEWREGLRLLLESKDLRRDIGLAAYEDVRRNHTTKTRARMLEQALASLIGEAGARDERLTLNWLASSSSTFELPRHLAESGHDVRVHVEPNSEVGSGVQGLEVEAGYEGLRPADASVATSSRAAQVVAAHDSSLFKCFLISAVDEDEAAYGLPLRHIAMGKEVAEQLSRLTGRPIDELDAPEPTGESFEAAARQLERILQRTCLVRLRDR